MLRKATATDVQDRAGARAPLAEQDPGDPHGLASDVLHTTLQQRPVTQTFGTPIKVPQLTVVQPERHGAVLGGIISRRYIAEDRLSEAQSQKSPDNTSHNELTFA